MSLPLAMLVGALRDDDAPAGPPADEDARLVRACLAGERRAFDRLYRRHAAAVHRRLTRLLGRGPDVEDLVQQTFLEAFRSLPSFRGEARFSTWLHRIAIHVALAALRARRRRPRAAVAIEDIELAADGALDPEAQVRARQMYELALAQLEALTPDQRVAFVLRHIECLPLDEIGKLVGARAATVGQRIKKAERVLAARIERADRRARRRREGGHAPGLS